MTDVSERLRSKKKKLAEVRAEVKELADRDNLTAGEETHFDRKLREAEKLTDEATDLQRQFNREIEDGLRSGLYTTEAGCAGGVGDRSFEHMSRTDPWRDTRPREESDARDRALAAMDRADHIEQDSVRSYVTQLVERASGDGGKMSRWAEETSDPRYMMAFAKLLIDPTRGHLEFTEGEQAAYPRVQTFARAASLTDSAGGALVPTHLDPAVVLVSAGSRNPFRQVANIKTIATDVFNGVTSTGISASWDTEGAEASDDAPTFGQFSLTPQRGTVFVPYSIEVGQDAPTLLQELSRLTLDAKDQLEATAFATGSGSGANPTGIVTALTGSASEYVQSTNSTLAIADVFGAVEALEPRYQDNAKHLMPLPIINQIRRLATNANYDFSAFLTDGSPARLLGKPVVEASTISSTLDTSSNFVHVYGDWDQFYICDRIGTTAELVPHLMGDSGRPTGQRGIFTYWRTTSDSVCDTGFVLSVNPAV